MFVAATCAVAACVAGCGSTQTGANASVASEIAVHGRPQVVDPVAGQMPSVPTASAAAASADGAPGGEVSVSSDGGPVAQPESNVQVEQELDASGINPNPDKATLTASGLAIPPANAPADVVDAIQAANEIAHLPYIWGGGHGTYEDTGYDCSGSLSFILASAGLLNGTETSGELMSYGAPGPGKWISIFATNGHTFAIIAGLRFDTVALAETGTRWSNKPPDEPDIDSFVERHPVGL